MQAAMVLENDFLHAFNGRFSGVLRWPQLDELWNKLLSDAEAQWYVYAVGELPPTQPLSAEALKKFVQHLDELLRREHDESYCGIVYADHLMAPSFIKIFDPNNLGSTCGSSKVKPLPGWIISKLAPIDLPGAMPVSNNRRRWWQSLFKTKV